MDKVQACTITHNDEEWSFPPFVRQSEKEAGHGQRCHKPEENECYSKPYENRAVDTKYKGRREGYL